jgi:uncharacterized membrane protein YgcG
MSMNRRETAKVTPNRAKEDSAVPDGRRAESARNDAGSLGRSRRRWLLGLGVLVLLLVLIIAVPRQADPRQGLKHPDSAFEDRIGLVSKDYAWTTAGMLLREPRYQMVVYVDASLPPEPLSTWSIAQATAWRVGEQQDNGIALFIFRDARIARVVVGYALEDRLPDALVRRLLEDRLAPRFAAGDFEGGFDALIKGIDGALGGDEALGKLWLELGGKPRQSTADMLLALYTEGAERAPRLAASAWRTYLEGDAAERVFVLLCAGFLLALLSATVAVIWVTIKIFAKVHKGKNDAPGPALESRAASPPTSNLAVGWVGAFFSSLAIALLTLILAFALSLAEDLMHRKGDFSGAGAEVVWPTAR